MITSYPLIGAVPAGPSPVPTSIALGETIVDNTGTKMVVLQLATPSGVQVYFLDADAARAVGAKLTEMVSGIVLAPASTPLPPVPRNTR